MLRGVISNALLCLRGGPALNKCSSWWAFRSMSYRFLISNKQDTHLIASLGFKTFQKWVLRYLALWAKRRGNCRTKHFASGAEQSLQSPQIHSVHSEDSKKFEIIIHDVDIASCVRANCGLRRHSTQSVSVDTQGSESGRKLHTYARTEIVLLYLNNALLEQRKYQGRLNKQAGEPVLARCFLRGSAIGLMHMIDQVSSLVCQPVIRKRNMVMSTKERVRNCAARKKDEKQRELQAKNSKIRCCLRKLLQRHPILSSGGLETVAKHRNPRRDQIYQSATFG
ncbi:hypothetical protein Tco_1491003 [Tanacetum coccineum]